MDKTFRSEKTNMKSLLETRTSLNGLLMSETSSLSRVDPFIERNFEILSWFKFFFLSILCRVIHPLSSPISKIFYTWNFDLLGYPQSIVSENKWLFPWFINMFRSWELISGCWSYKFQVLEQKWRIDVTTFFPSPSSCCWLFRISDIYLLW